MGKTQRINSMIYKKTNRNRAKIIGTNIGMRWIQ